MRLQPCLYIVFSIVFFVSNTIAQELLPAINSDSSETWISHFQLTTIYQAHPAFSATYSGPNSLHDTSEHALSLTSTLYLGRALWKNAAIYFNPEIAGGNGVSYALGLAGAANGETFRIGSPAPALYTARAYFQQSFPVGNTKYEWVESGQNQLAGWVPVSRFVFSVGKFSIADFFDKNKYSHDPRGQFINWALMSNGAWDYPANTRGYTWGAVLEYIEPGWSFRMSSVLMPVLANGQQLDWNYGKAHSETIELERQTVFNNRRGSIRLLGFYSTSRAPEYKVMTSLFSIGDSGLVSVVTGKRTGPAYGGMKYGFGLSLDQELTQDLGLFLRASWNDGATATWAFTEIDRSVSLGFNLKTRKFKRPNDIFGFAVLMNGISGAHRDYLNAGGTGFMIGDGKLTHYDFEEIAEIYYKTRLTEALYLTGDYQFVRNPAYNYDRGPVSIFAIRAHIEF